MILIILIFWGTPKDPLGCAAYQEYSGDIREQDFKEVHKRLLVCHRRKLFYVNSNHILVDLDCPDLMWKYVKQLFNQLLILSFIIGDGFTFI